MAFINELPETSGDCSSEEVALEKLNEAIRVFNDAEDGNRDYEGYVLMNKLINYLTHLNSCNGGCESPTCDEYTDQANEMSECLFNCDSPYAEDHCNTAAYINCQCDCTCENWHEADCDDYADPCAGVDQEGYECCNKILFEWDIQEGTDDLKGCCIITSTIINPECCETSVGSILFHNFPDTGCEIRSESTNADQTAYTITVCCEGNADDTVLFYAKAGGPCDTESKRLSLEGCGN